MSIKASLVATCIYRKLLIIYRTPIIQTAKIELFLQTFGIIRKSQNRNGQAFELVRAVSHLGLSMNIEQQTCRLDCRVHSYDFDLHCGPPKSVHTGESHKWQKEKRTWQLRCYRHIYIDSARSS